MARKPNSAPPKLRRHKPSGQAVVTLSRRDFYLGPWPESEPHPPAAVQAAYDARVAEWLANGRKFPDPPTPVGAPGTSNAAHSGDVTVADLCLAWLEWAKTHYQGGSGKRGEYANARFALRPLSKLFAALPVEQFGPLALKQVRDKMVEAGLCRGEVNKRIQKIVRVFKWGVGEELVPEGTWRALTAVAGLRESAEAGKGPPEAEPVEPVALADYAATLPFLPAHAAGALRFMRWTGCRPGEVCRLTLAALDRSGSVWTYSPTKHKTAWRGKKRTIAIGPKAQAVVVAFIRIRCPLCKIEGLPRRIGSRDGILCGPCGDRTQREGLAGPWVRQEVQSLDQPLFSPRVQREEIDEEKRRCRRSKVQPSQKNRKKAKPVRLPGEYYTPNTLAQAVTRAAKAAGVAPWSPNQLRHLRATEVRREHGLEGAQVTLGHSTADVTQIYAERDLAFARKIANEMG